MNITRLIPYLLNKITKNEKEIVQVQSNLDNINLSPYQLKSEKNSVDGYLGLDSDNKIHDYTRLKPKNRFSYSPNVLLSSTVTSNSNVSIANLGSPKLRTSNNTYMNLSSITINSSSVGYGSAQILNGVTRRFYLSNNGILYSKINISFDTITNVKILASMGTIWLTASTGTIGGGGGTVGGAYFYFDSSVNSGKWNCCALESGITTTYNTNATPIVNQEVSLLTTYNKSTSELKFYINDILQTTMTITFSDSIIFSQYLAISSNVTTSTRAVGLIDSVFELEI